MVTEVSLAQPLLMPADHVIQDEAVSRSVGAQAGELVAFDKDENANVLLGDVMAVNTNNTLLLVEGRPVACVGLNNLVVETCNAVLVSDRGHVRQVNDIVVKLKSQHWPESDNLPQGVPPLRPVRQCGREGTLAGQTHCGESGYQPVFRDTPPLRRTLDRGFRRNEGHARQVASKMVREETG